MRAETYLHPGHINHNLACDTTVRNITSYTTVFGFGWIHRNLSSIYRLFLPGDVDAVTLERGDTTYRYYLTDQEADLE